MATFEQTVQAIAQRHGLSQASASQLVSALVTTGGRQVQFNIPEFGGMGQWMPGMVMAGDLFNHALKARVDAVCSEIAQLIRGGSLVPVAATPAVSLQWSPQPAWWPAHLGVPATSGGQNNLRYAWFPDMRRLAVELGGVITLYDSGDHRIGGVSQQQSAGGMSITFTSQHGVIDLARLPVVSA